MDEDKILSYRQNKVIEIERILDEDEIDLWALRELCLTEGGLVNGEFICSVRWYYFT